MPRATQPASLLRFRTDPGGLIAHLLLPPGRRSGWLGLTALIGAAAVALGSAARLVAGLALLSQRWLGPQRGSLAFPSLDLLLQWAGSGAELELKPQPGPRRAVADPGAERQGQDQPAAGDLRPCQPCRGPAELPAAGANPAAAPATLPAPGQSAGTAAFPRPRPGERARGDAVLRALMERVGLTNLPGRHGDLAVGDAWSRVLSGGEQQRLGFARLLLRHPALAILDEASSALDRDAEHVLHAQLMAAGPTPVSVGDRPTLRAVHPWELTLLGGGRWRLAPIAVLP